MQKSKTCLPTGKIKIHVSRAFTLIEILVASFIFLIVILIGTAVFGAAVGNRAKANIVRATQQGARYAVEAMSREIRMANVTGAMNKVYYGFAIMKNDGDDIQETLSNKLYSGTRLVVADLDSNNVRTERLYYLKERSDTPGCLDLVVAKRITNNWSRDQINLNLNDFTGEDRITSEDVCVEDLRFDGFQIIQEKGDASRGYLGGYPPSYNNGLLTSILPYRQPFVTIHLVVKHKENVRIKEQETLTINTTVASRYYNITGGQFPPPHD